MPLALWIIDISATISNRCCIRKMLAFKALPTHLSCMHTAVLFLLGTIDLKETVDGLEADIDPDFGISSQV